MLLVHMYVYFAYVRFFLSFSLPLGHREWPRIVIVALTKRLATLFVCSFVVTLSYFLTCFQQDRYMYDYKNL